MKPEPKYVATRLLVFKGNSYLEGTELTLLPSDNMFVQVLRERGLLEEEELCFQVGDHCLVLTTEEYKRVDAVETNITKRWEEGMEHHPESEHLAKLLFDLDRDYGGDYFCWKSGGDGDNGEHLMYCLDIYFEKIDRGEEV